MPVFKRRSPPESWAEVCSKSKHPWILPLQRIEWVLMWIAYWLSGWAFLEVLEYLGTLSLLLAVISYFAESSDRLKQKHYQAWQVINSAHAKGGSGGRIDALEQLHEDGVLLVGVDVSEAFLLGIRLNKADLSRSNFHDADVRGADFDDSRFEFADLSSANFRQASFRKTDLHDASLENADLNGADLTGADLQGTNLAKADLRSANLQNCDWHTIANIKLANIYGVRNAPPGFEKWALENGAVSVESDTDWDALMPSETAAPK